jgi:hypothetical protein
MLDINCFECIALPIASARVCEAQKSYLPSRGITYEKFRRCIIMGDEENKEKIEEKAEKAGEAVGKEIKKGWGLAKGVGKGLVKGVKGEGEKKEEK